MLGDARTLLPVGELAVTTHEPVLSSSNNYFTLFEQTRAIRVMEGGTGYYMGMMSPPITGGGGIAELPGRSSFALPSPGIIAHELGHNLNLRHAPCGGAGGPDVGYPYPDGSVGAWGYDPRDAGRLVHPSALDLMSYCGPLWISDYHFTNALRYRLFDKRTAGGGRLGVHAVAAALGRGGSRQRALPGTRPRDRRAGRASRLRGRLPDHRSDCRGRRTLLV